MDTKSKSELKPMGLYVRGIPLFNEARTGLKEDGSRWVRVQSEISLQPGIAILERYYDPEKTPEVDVNENTVTKYPKLKEMEPVTLRVLRFREYNKQLIIKEAEFLP